MSNVAQGRWLRSPWAALGTWLIVAAVVLMAVNTARAFVDPAGFASYMGLPLVDATDSGFVFVYALRAAFLALAALALLLKGEMRALGLFAAVAVVMPLGDATLTAAAGAPPAIVARHAATAIYLATAASFLFRWARRNAA